VPTRAPAVTEYWNRPVPRAGTTGAVGAGDDGDGEGDHEGAGVKDGEGAAEGKTIGVLLTAEACLMRYQTTEEISRISADSAIDNHQRRAM